MKLLCFFCNEFSYTPQIKTLPDYPDFTKGKTFNNLILAFIQAEVKDEENAKSVENKLLNQLKWIARKNETKNIVLHSFAHLSPSKAGHQFTKELLDNIETRLKNVDFITEQTPFGYFLDIKMDAPGKSLARLFTEF